MFPGIKDPQVENKRLKNVGLEVYIYVTTDDQENYVLRMKTIKQESISKPERKYLKLI